MLIEHPIEKPPKHIDADYAIRTFEIAKKEKKNPLEIAKEIYEKLKDNPYIEKIELKGPYVNIKLRWNKILTYILNNKEKLFSFDKKDKKIIVEHTSVNPNKALHIGHLRNAVLGDTLVRLLRFYGYNVQVLNYIDDTGSQVADTVLGFYFLGFPEDPKEFDLDKWLERLKEFLKRLNYSEEKIKEIIEKVRELVNERMEGFKKIYGEYKSIRFDIYAGDFVYVIVNKLYELVPELKEFQKKIIKEIEEGKGKIYEYTMKFTRKILELQLDTLWKFEIYYDLLNKESDILHFGFWDYAFKVLKERGFVIYITEGDLKGTWSLDLEKIGLKELGKYKVLVRSDGTTVYLAKDIGYAFWKHGLIDKDFKYREFCVQPNNEVLWETSKDGIKNPKDFGNADISINVIGMEQKYLQKIVEKLIETFTNGKKKYIYYGYGLVMLSSETAKLLGFEAESKVVKMSGRKGLVINVEILLERLKEKIFEILKERGNPDKTLAFKIARSTLRYEMLKVSPDKVIVFDVKKALDLEEDTAIYLMYTYARAINILKKIEKVPEYKEPLELTREEKELVKLIYEFKMRIQNTAETLKLTILTEYARELALAFNEFYQKVPVIKELEEKPYRYYIVKLFEEVFGKVLEILGIDKVERI